MTKLEIIMALTVFMSIIWAGIVTIYALQAIKKYKEKVAYYQHPQIQCEIARNVIKNKWYTDGGEVYR
ncbi:MULTISPECIES: hypothetical protein [Streptococcus]|uniref:hypothetical protein n=1 Tax=Streptococcus TaxID=1301 RepID=UPI0002B9EA72|nr:MULTISPECIES: hypothetical protein [Streptococcus]QBX15983.1 hypothetical protein Javan23_0018 [Streptococcus phage Javan23]QBX25915.1 hypothetical protein Javan28_0018 [Streptococcus phage Javan28]ASA89220.1 hypothetical protein BB164_01125 [Streptococcus agalactiae]EMC0663343.1 hypothetical protein [Streptococcus agalactiae]EPT73234.1 hypothetical protein SAG0067_08140 [Streptococcus agalactiae CCUG 39096 A]